MFECTYCGSSIKNAGALAQHEEYCRENPENFKPCKVCGNPVSDDDRTYCSYTCSHKDRSHSEETKNKISSSFQQNGIEYEGPNNDSYHRKSPAPPISMIFYFKTEKELKKAAYVVWESDVEIITIVKEGGDEVLNSATELYEYVDKSQDVEIV